MSPSVLIVDFSGTYPLLDCPGNTPGAAWLHLGDLEGTSCYLDPEARGTLEQKIAPFPVEGMHFIDSGDYHYMSKLFTDRIGERFNLLVLDHHPDMQEPLFGSGDVDPSERILSCGGWLRDALIQNPNIGKVLVVGVKDDLSGECEGFADRVRTVLESEVALRADYNIIVERMLSFLEEEVPLYISVDKDVLSEDECPTNWDGGSMSVEGMLHLLCAAVARRNVIGVDICGEKSPSKGGTPYGHTKSSEVNGKLLSIFFNDK